MRKYLILTILIITFFSVFSQIPQKKNTIFLEPSSIVNFMHPAIEFGYEREFNSINSIKANVGILTPRSLEGFLLNALITSGERYDSTGFYIFSGHKFSLEYRYWIRKNYGWSHNSWFSKFIAINVFYKNNITTTNDYFLINDSTYNYPSSIEIIDDVYNEQFSVNKIKLGLDFKVGLHKVKRNWVTTLSAGIGIQRRYATHSDRINMNDKLEADNIAIPRFLVSNRYGNDWEISFPFDFIIGFKF